MISWNGAVGATVYLSTGAPPLIDWKSNAPWWIAQLPAEHGVRRLALCSACIGSLAPSDGGRVGGGREGSRLSVRAPRIGGWDGPSLTGTAGTEPNSGRSSTLSGAKRRRTHMAKKDKRQKTEHEQTGKKRAPTSDRTRRSSSSAAMTRSLRWASGRTRRRKRAPVQVARPEARGQRALTRRQAPSFSSWPSAASTTTPVLISSS